MSNEFIYGIHAVKAVLERDPVRFIEAYVLKGRQDERLMPVLNELTQIGVSIQQMNRKTLDDKARGANHQGIIAKVKPAKQLNENDLDSILSQHAQPLLLILDGVTDLIIWVLVYVMPMRQVLLLLLCRKIALRH